MSTPTAETLEQLARIVGARRLLTAANELEPFLTDHRALYHGRALAVAQPETAEQVAQLLAVCNQARIGVVPQGGNTGYCGGATPDESGAQLVVSLARLKRIRALDALNYSLVAEAGCVLADVQRAAEDAQRYFPLSLGSEGSCQIGGNLSTNAGGVHVLRYGMMRELVLGLEVALPDGRLLSSLTRLRKDNTGYDIKSLFLGAEGTLGIITAASLKLFPRIRATATAFAAVRDPRAALELLARLREASGDRVSSFELIPRLAVELTVRHIQGVRDPLQGAHSWYVLCELSSSRTHDTLETMLSECLERALDDGLLADAVLARNERDRAALWKLRETIPEAQRRDGASLKHDISVPVAAIAEFIERAGAWVRAHVPDGRLVAYGHAGDGNLHFNINQAPDADRGAFLARGDAVKRAIHDLVRDFDGSISAEHGIGRLKVAELERYAPAVELELMRAVKLAFDPNGIMNPGKVLR
ncbi:MAG: FAD-binding oxidoreductase [Pseudomonadota bacterium]|jgi:D-lactate dehydrogenase (cytochrome)|nr:FAD-binding oxidoreductase [Pseudomonadota bacterium]